MALRSYHFEKQEVDIPAFHDFLVVAYRRGVTHMHRRLEGGWTRTKCVPGDLSLLTRSQLSQWHWTEDIDVSHVYLSESLLSGVASEVLDRKVDEVCLHDVLNFQDPIVVAAANAITAEASNRAAGSALYVEAVATQLAVHLFRHYASATFLGSANEGGLSSVMASRIEEYIVSKLHEQLDLSSLAAVTGLGNWSFTRRFRKTFNQPVHAYVIERRVERAKQLLIHSSRMISEIAQDCGFSDQSHMTRVFQARLRTTPAVFRRESI